MMVTTRFTFAFPGLVAAAVLSIAASSSSASAQAIVYQSLSPVVPVAAAPAYVANYTPAGNYAAVTAFSPPVVATLPTSSVAVTSFYAPAMPTAVPVTSYYGPAAVAAPVATTAFYAPAATVVAAPVTTYYAPTAVAVPLYRRGPLGVYRPVRTAFYYPY
ncbi:MAG: hypothetical protein ACKOYJ_05220 [Planctomycetia bacterium]